MWRVANGFDNADLKPNLAPSNTRKVITTKAFKLALKGIKKSRGSKRESRIIWMASKACRYSTIILSAIKDLSNEFEAVPL